MKNIQTLNNLTIKNKKRQQTYLLILSIEFQYLKKSTFKYFTIEH